jgi:hypothetical protein
MSPAVVLGLVLLAIYWAWIAVFFARVRPWIMKRVGGRLGVKVEESTDVLDAGTYGVKGRDPSIPKTGAVLLADIVVLLAGVVGVAALIFVPAFIVAESGALLPVEASLTGRGAALRVFDDVAMSASETRAMLALDVRNMGREPLRGCIGGVDGYSARNGYLHGATDRFDLAVGERRPVMLALDAARPPRGEHRFRLKLECGNERLAVTEALLVVR